jgi:hypothetical protein
MTRTKKIVLGVIGIAAAAVIFSKLRNRNKSFAVPTKEQVLARTWMTVNSQGKPVVVDVRKNLVSIDPATNIVRSTGTDWRGTFLSPDAMEWTHSSGKVEVWEATTPAVAGVMGWN